MRYTLKDTLGIFELPSDKFVRPKRSLGSDFEVISPTAVTPKRVRAISDVRRALRRAGVKLVKYKENVASGSYDKAVTRMADRSNRMDKEDFKRYLSWVKETNPTLATTLKARVAKIKSQGGGRDKAPVTYGWEVKKGTA